jgi:membrane-bound lytic murein transglycosylase D
MMIQALRENHMPEQLAWLPLIESGFKTRALSKARALGPWQFIPSTGYRYGLARNHWYDERMDPVKSTYAAIAYLQDLHGLFGDWLTALAAYNCGEGRVLRTINRQHINYLDHFWDLYTQLPRETARYVPRFIATLLIINDPAKYGFELPPVDPPVHYESVEIERAIALDQLDQVLGLEKGELKALNPEIRRGVTPNKNYTLRVPIQTSDEVLAKIDSLPKAELTANEFVVHRVRRGDSLSKIASRYGTTISRIMAANRLSNQHRIWPGQKIKVPGRNVSLVDLANEGKAQSGNRSWKTYTVRAGDSLWRIAKNHNVSVSDVKSWNSLNNNRLHLGQQLKLMAPGGDGSARTYAVRSGDTLGSIAKKHGVALAALLAANKMSNRDTIYPNQKLVIP